MAVVVEFAAGGVVGEGFGEGAVLHEPQLALNDAGRGLVCDFGRG